MKIASVNEDSPSQSPLLDVARSSEDVAAASDTFVYGFIDLFSGYGESWNWGVETDDASQISSSLNSHTSSRSRQVYEGVERNFSKKGKTSKDDSRHASIFSIPANLNSVDEGSEGENTGQCGADSRRSLSEDMVGSDPELKDNKVQRHLCLGGLVKNILQ